MLLPQTCVLALINQEVEKHSEELWLKPQTIPTTASFSQIGSDRSRVAYRTVAMSVPRSGIISSSSQQRLLSAPRYRQSHPKIYKVPVRRRPAATLVVASLGPDPLVISWLVPLALRRKKKVERRSPDAKNRETGSNWYLCFFSALLLLLSECVTRSSKVQLLNSISSGNHVRSSSSRCSKFMRVFVFIISLSITFSRSEDISTTVDPYLLTPLRPSHSFPSGSVPVQLTSVRSYMRTAEVTQENVLPYRPFNPLAANFTP